MMLKIAVVEDEKVTQDYLKDNIERFFNDNNVEIEICFFDTGFVFLDKYNCDFDLVFMDISMPGMNGLETAEQLRKIDQDVLLIFITSLAQYAVKGYKVNAFDFIVKPFDYYDLNLTLLRALPNLKNKKESIIITTNERERIKILLDDLDYIEASDHYNLFHVLDKVYTVCDTLKKYENLLKDKSFSLCNRCYLVNLKSVTNIKGNIVTVGKDELIISRPKKTMFIKALNQYLTLGK